MNAASLFDALGMAPSLPGALCRGRSSLFDWDPNAHHDDAEFAEHAALRLCASCPALASCGRWFDALPETRRPQGVIAGIVNVPPPRGRPRHVRADIGIGDE